MLEEVSKENDMITTEADIRYNNGLKNGKYKAISPQQLDYNVEDDHSLISSYETMPHKEKIIVSKEFEEVMLGKSRAKYVNVNKFAKEQHMKKKDLLKYMRQYGAKHGLILDKLSTVHYKFNKCKLK